MKLVKCIKESSFGECPFCLQLMRLIHSDKSIVDYNNDMGECPSCKEVVIFKILPIFHFEEVT